MIELATDAAALGLPPLPQPRIFVGEAQPSTVLRGYSPAQMIAYARDAVVLATIEKVNSEYALRKNFLRYLWLRDVGDATWRPFGIREGFSGPEADAAIDAAIAKSEEANNERCDVCAGRAMTCRLLGHRPVEDRDALWHPDDLLAAAEGR